MGLSLIARKLADRDDDGGEGGNGDEDDEDDDDEEEESKMSESYTYKPNKKYRKSHKPRSYKKRSVAEGAGVTESRAMEEAMDLVDGLREEQGRKNRHKLTKKFCKKCKKCRAAMNCNGADISKCNKVRNKCMNKFNVRIP